MSHKKPVATETIEQRMKRPERFRLRTPYFAIENEAILEGKHEETWGEAVEWLKRFKPDEVHSFKLQVNIVRSAPQPRPHTV